MQLPDDVADLMMRVLENPHDAAARAELDQLMHTRPELSAVWEQMRATYDITTDAFASRLVPVDSLPPVARAALPAQMPSASRNLTPIWPNLLALAAAVVVLFTVGRSPMPEAIDGATRLAATLPADSPLRPVLTDRLPAIITRTALTTYRAEQAPLALLSPLVATRAGPVTIAWRAAPPADALTIELFENDRLLWSTTTAPDATTVTTPRLESEGVFEVRIRRRDDSALLLREVFITVTAAPPPVGTDPFARIVADATATPARLGDAVLGWYDLPPEFAAQPTARRLGLWLAQAADLPAVRADALRR